MKMSGNLVLALIGRALRVQLFGDGARATTYLHSSEDQAEFLIRMDRALASRDADAAVATLQGIVDLNQRLVLTALQAAHAEGNGNRKTAS